MSSLISEFWLFFTGAFLIGASTLWAYTRLGWSRRLMDNEEGWRRRTRSLEESWAAKMKQARAGFERDLKAREGQDTALRAELAQGREELEAQRVDLGRQRRELHSAKRQESAARAELDATRDELTAVQAELSAAHGELTSARLGRNVAQEELSASRAELDTLSAQLREQQDKNTAALKAFERAKREFEAYRTDWLQSQEKLATLDDRLAGALDLSDRFELDLRATREELARQIDVNQEAARALASLMDESERLRLRIRDIPGLERQIRNERSERVRLQEDIDALKYRLTESQTQLDQYRRRLAESLEEAEAGAGRVRKLERRIKDMEPAALKLQTSSAEVQVLKNRVRELEMRSFSQRDDLKRIRGVGPSLERLLNSLGVTSFRQIADWEHTDIDRIDVHLGEFRGRVERDEWVEQARTLYRQKYGQEPTHEA